MRTFADWIVWDIGNAFDLNPFTLSFTRAIVVAVLAAIVAS